MFNIATLYFGPWARNPNLGWSTATVFRGYLTYMVYSNRSSFFLSTRHGARVVRFAIEKCQWTRGREMDVPKPPSQLSTPYPP